jgi:hypothetical protein
MVAGFSVLYKIRWNLRVLYDFVIIYNILVNYVDSLTSSCYCGSKENLVLA